MFNLIINKMWQFLLWLVFSFFLVFFTIFAMIYLVYYFIAKETQDEEI